MSEGLSSAPVSRVQTSTGRNQQLGGNQSQDRTWTIILKHRSEGGLGEK